MHRANWVVVAFGISASALVMPTLAVAEPWDVGCANGVCVALSQGGQLVFFDQSSHAVNGTEQLGNAFKPPGSIGCSAIGVGESCIIVDAAGQIWLGPLRPTMNSKYDVVAKVP